MLFPFDFELVIAAALELGAAAVLTTPQNLAGEGHAALVVHDFAPLGFADDLPEQRQPMMAAFQSSDMIAHSAKDCFLKFPKRAASGLTAFGQPCHHGGFADADRQRAGAQGTGFLEGFDERVSGFGREFGGPSMAHVSEKFLGERHAQGLPTGRRALRSGID